MSDIIRYINAVPTQSRQIFTGSPIVINTGGAGNADQTTISPPIPGLSAGTVQEAIAELSKQAVITKPTAADIGGHRVVYLTSTGLKYASNDESSHIGLVLGVTLGATVQNAQASVRVTGEVTEPSWNWTSPGLVFLGQNGLLIQSSPGPPAVFSQVIGQAISPTTIFINIQSPIILG